MGFYECMKKYKFDTIVESDSSLVDAMWLLFGLKDQGNGDKLHPYQNIDWTQDLCDKKMLIPDGIAPVYPGADRLHDLLVELGVLEEK